MRKEKERDLVLYGFGYIHSWLLLSVLYQLFLSFVKEISWQDLGRACLLWGPVLVLGEIQKRGKTLWSLFLTASIWAALLWGLGKSRIEKGMFLFLVIFLFLLYCAERIQGQPGMLLCPGYPYLILYGVGYVFSVIYEQEFLSRVLLFWTGLYWLLILWHRNRQQVLLFQEENQGLRRFPGETIANASRISLVLFSVITVAGMVALPFSGIDRCIYGLGHLLRRFIAGSSSDHSGEGPPFMEQTQEPQVMDPFVPEQGESSPFWQAFWDILEQVVLVALLFLVIAALCRALYWLYKKYNARVLDNGDILEVLPRAIPDKKERAGKRKRISPGLFSKRPEDKIRRYYRRKIEEHVEPEFSFTPAELEKAAGLSQKVGIEDFHRLYEKARYSGKSCTRQEAGKMKELGKQM